LAAGISAALTYAVFATTFREAPKEDRSFDLPCAKAATLFESLEPRDVKVLVRQEGGLIQITGTKRECDAVGDFVSLVTRCGGLSSCEVDKCIQKARVGWTTHRAYKLPKKKAQILFDALAPADVPVLVSLKGTRVRIDASPQDQEVVSSMVDILRGRRP
jgi:hypothetical protein